MKQQILNRNEMVVGPAPACLRVLREFSHSQASLYIDGYFQSLLIPKLSALLRIPERQIITCYGAEDFLRSLIDQCDPKRDIVLAPQYHYLYYSLYARHKKVRFRTFTMDEAGNRFTFDIEDCLSQYRRYKPKIVLLASPNNPTGNLLSFQDAERILGVVSRSTLVVIDEAYLGFQKPRYQQGFLPLIRRFPNLILLRSFSKLYALAGLRIGFALCGRGVNALLRYQPRYLGMSRVLEQVAIAALESSSYYRQVARNTIQLRQRFIRSLDKCRRIQAFESHANFVLIKVQPSLMPSLWRKINQERVVIAKRMTKNYVRVSLTAPAHVRLLIAILRSIDKE